jgi:hypothetical protein
MTTERPKLKPGWAFRQAKPAINEPSFGVRPAKGITFSLLSLAV